MAVVFIQPHRHTTIFPVKFALGVNVQPAFICEEQASEGAKCQTWCSVPGNLVVFVVVNAFDDINLTIL